MATRRGGPSGRGLSAIAIQSADEDGKVCQLLYAVGMSTMNVSLPDELKSYVDAQIGDGAYGSTSEYVRDLIRRDRDRQQLRRALLDGATSSPGPIADKSYITTLRDRLRSAD